MDGGNGGWRVGGRRCLGVRHTHGLGDLPDLLENRGFLYSRGEMLISFPHGHSRLRFIEIIGVKIKAQIIITVTPLSHRGRGVSIYNGIRTMV